MPCRGERLRSEPRIAFIGAGSLGFTRGLVRDTLTFPLMRDATLVLMGINQERLEFARKACQIIVDKANKAALVLATPSIRGELPDGRNSNNPKIEQYAEITRKVARDTRTTLVDLRRASIAHLQNHNAQLRVDGTLCGAPSGILTYDGVHPRSQNVALLADLIGDGIFRALVSRE